MSLTNHRSRITIKSDREKVFHLTHQSMIIIAKKTLIGSDIEAKPKIKFDI